MRWFHWLFADECPAERRAPDGKGVERCQLSQSHDGLHEWR